MVVFILSIVIGFVFLGCHKNNSDPPNLLYGKWSKGINWGDTLFFYQKDGRNKLLYQVSFNPAFPAPAETDYSYANDKLEIGLFRGGALKPIESFKWIQYGQEFEIQGLELYSFMSSTQVYFRYHRLQ